jgi:hypothetical protein
VTDNPRSLGSGEFMLFEFPFAFWLEQHGYDITYCADEDVHNSLDTVTRCKAFLSVGHDYWSRKQYDHCVEAVRRGVNFGIFSGNPYGQKITANVLAKWCARAPNPARGESE